MVASPLQNKNRFAIEEENKKILSHRTLGERCYYVLNSICVGVIANVGLSYFLARDNEIYKIRHNKSEVDKPEAWQNSKIYLPMWFHAANDKIETFVKPYIAKLGDVLPEALKSKHEENNKSKLAKRGANIFSNTLLLSWSSLILVWPQTLLHNRKLQIIKKCDAFFDQFRGESTPEDKLKRSLAYERIAETAPKKSIWHMLKLRVQSMFLVMVTSLAGVLIDKERKGLMRLEELFSVGVDKIEKMTGRKFSWSDGNRDTTTFREKMATNIATEVSASSVNLILEALENRKIRKKHEKAFSQSYRGPYLAHLNADFCEMTKNESFVEGVERSRIETQHAWVGA